MSAELLQKLPGDVQQATGPLFEELPIEKAMQKLVVPGPPNNGDLIMAVEEVITKPAISKNPPLQAALWLYIDELDRSHVISQQIDDATGAYWHGMMHRREGDFGNSHYWFRKAGSHPAIAALEGYDPHKLIDDAEAAHKQGEAPDALIAKQRDEWANLFAWCAKQ